ncbi:hypothetical protein GGR55DRAFT_633940 [Xylaria sp. FL0064]|nr:hypothetical protein GGR55DRAFT_633940 [Xylaria sp. FL0064]
MTKEDYYLGILCTLHILVLAYLDVMLECCEALVAFPFLFLILWLLTARKSLHGSTIPCTFHFPSLAR